MSTFMRAPAWIVAEFCRVMANSGAFAKRMPSVVRVRRRGFPREARRGFEVRRPDGIYRVVRRSNWNLWLEKVREADDRPMVGDTIRVRAPKRYETTSAGDTVRLRSTPSISNAY